MQHSCYLPGLGTKACSCCTVSSRTSCKPALLVVEFSKVHGHIIHALCTLSNGNLAAPGGRDEWKTMHAAYDQLITLAATNTLGCMQNNPPCWSVGNNIVVRRGQLCCCMCYAVEASERCSLQHNVVPQDDHAADVPVAAATVCSFCPVRSTVAFEILCCAWQTRERFASPNPQTTVSVSVGETETPGSHRLYQVLPI